MLLGSFCGSAIPSTVTSTSNSVRLQFTSDNTLTFTGFRAVYQFIGKQLFNLIEKQSHLLVVDNKSFRSVFSPTFTITQDTIT